MSMPDIQVNDKPGIHQKICIVSPYKSGEHYYAHVLYKILQKMGYTVEMIDHREDRKKLPELFQNINADLVIVLRGDGIPPGLIDSLSCPTVLWYSENISGYEDSALGRLRELQYNSTVFDYVILTTEGDPDSLQVLRNLGCNRVGCVYPNRFDPTMYRKLNLPKFYDVFFVGTLTPRRKKILGTLAKRFKVEFRNIWDLEEQVRFYNQSKIVLHINAFHFLTMEHLNLRACDVMGCGTFMLHEDVVFHKQAEDRKHMVYWSFNDIDDLADIIEYYLSHEEERERIAESGYRFVRDNWSVDRVVQKFLSFFDLSIRAATLSGEGFGVASDKWGRRTKSKNELEKALEPVISPNYPHSFYERGKFYLQLHRWEKAAQLFEKSLEIDVDFADSIFLLSLSYQRLQRPSDALRLLRRLRKLKPFNAEVNLSLGELYTAMGVAEQGNYYKQKALKLAPNPNTRISNREYLK